MKKISIIVILICISSFCRAQDVKKADNSAISYLSGISKFLSYDFGNYTVNVFVKDNKPGTLNNNTNSEEISQDIIVIIKSGDVKPEVNGFLIKNVFLEGPLEVKFIKDNYYLEFKDGVSQSLKKYRFNKQGKILQ